MRAGALGVRAGTCNSCTVPRMLSHEIDEYVSVAGSKVPCQPALRVGQCAKCVPSACHVMFMVWPLLSKPF